jgi:hypothetical protein
MKWEISLLTDLQRMREKIDRVWDRVSNHSPFAQEREIWQWVERFPKFEGRGRRCLRLRLKRTIKF